MLWEQVENMTIRTSSKRCLLIWGGGARRREAVPGLERPWFQGENRCLSCSSHRLQVQCPVWVLAFCPALPGQTPIL